MINFPKQRFKIFFENRGIQGNVVNWTRNDLKGEFAKMKGGIGLRRKIFDANCY